MVGGGGGVQHSHAGAIIVAFHATGATDHAAALFGRYVDWSLIDDEIEANFPTVRAG